MTPAHHRGIDDDPGINMTPMIDIVFQLIVFFLLTLKFKSVDRRIDSALPRNVGPQIWPADPDDTPRLVVKLFREHHEEPERAFTRVRVGNRTTFDLPRDDAGAERAHVLEALTAEIGAVYALMGAETEGEIKTPPPKGVSVPHGDVMAVLDAFIRADVKKVGFEGALSPLPPGR